MTSMRMGTRPATSRQPTMTLSRRSRPIGKPPGPNRPGGRESREAAVARHRITATELLKAPADVVYRVLADYREHHPRILPAVFSNFVVHERGFGAGTRMG